MARADHNDTQKPLLGFGPAGWVLSVIAVALAIVLVTGYDLRHGLLWLVNYTLGADAMMWCYSPFIAMHHLDLMLGGPPGMKFGVVTMCCVFVTMQVHPRRFGWWAWALVAACGILGPVLFHYGHRWADELIPQRTPGYDPAQGAMVMFAAHTAIGLVIAPLVGLALRSWGAGLWLLVLSLAAAVWMWDAGHALHKLPRRVVPINPFDSAVVWVWWAWNPVVFGGLFVWAIRARRRWTPPYTCSACGYDLRGTPSGPCPECGNAPAEAPKVAEGSGAT
ncbi:MAG: hypothetical protein ACKVU4_06915 [Phycisphaerales bacterium]